MKFACPQCTGVLARAPHGPAPVCPKDVALVGTPETVPTTGCLHDVANFCALPIRSKRHFVPRTGRGKFDCAYNPRNGNLDITVKLNLVTTAKWRFQTEGFTAQDLLDMQRDFAQNVPGFWNGKWVFQCRKAGFGPLPDVTPRFHIEFGSEGAHFNLIISAPAPAAAQNAAPGMRNCRGFVSINQIVSNDPTCLDRVELLDFHVRDFPHSLAPQVIAQFERERLEDAVKAVGEAATAAKEKWIFLAFDVLGETERVRLRTFANTGKERLSGTDKIPLIMSGVARASEAATRARERAEAVAGVLTAAGFDNPVQYLASPAADRTGVKLRIDTAYEGTVAPFTYNVAAHEFGHMIGLPDEYENPQAAVGGRPDENAKALAKTRYLDLVAQAGLRPPSFPSHTLSMMSDGMTVMPFHTVTIWDALCFLTDGIIKPAEWAVSMV